MKVLVFVSVLFYQNIICNGIGLEFPDYANHPCNRKCEYKQNLRCHYNFTVETIFTNEPSCEACLTTNVTACFNKGCIVADGQRRAATVVNRMIPGPAIQVCLGDEIVVDVTNGLVVETVTIHWHGQHQRGTPYMDGVPYLTQCPIQPGATFRYHFIADYAGTHFYHSHIATQRINGLYGALIVRIPDAHNCHKPLYDQDLPEHTIIPMDWFRINPQTFVETYHRTFVFDPQLSGIMVNSRLYDGVNNVPPSRFYVQSGLRYRFRIIHNGALNCPLEIKFENHPMILISTDGADVRGAPIDTLTVTAGERYDVIINANQPIGLYWMKFKGLFQCNNVTGYAILQYDTTLNTTFPATSPTTESPDGIKFNCLNEAYGGPSCVQIPQLKAIKNMDPALGGTPDVVYYIGLDMLPGKPRKVLQQYGAEELIAETLNNITYVSRNVPFYQNQEYTFCNNKNADYGPNFYAECLHGLDVPLKGLIELVFIDQGTMPQMAHPMHLHGYAFSVVGEGWVANTVSVAQIKDMDNLGLIRRNIIDATAKDTIPVVDGGYTVVRFIADNKGFWFLHCHIELHAESGMALVIKTGDFNTKKIPKSFPKCGDYKEYNKLQKFKPKLTKVCT